VAAAGKGQRHKRIKGLVPAALEPLRSRNGMLGEGKASESGRLGSGREFTDVARIQQITFGPIYTRRPTNLIALWGAGSFGRDHGY
jgi:hypothetical protein